MFRRLNRHLQGDLSTKQYIIPYVSMDAMRGMDSIKMGCVNDQRDAQFLHNQFLFHSFLSALHVSNESSRSSSEARHNILVGH